MLVNYKEFEIKFPKWGKTCCHLQTWRQINYFQQKNQNNSITEKHTPTLFNLLHKVMFFLQFTQKIKKKKIMKMVEENQSISEKLESNMSTNNMNICYKYQAITEATNF